MAKNHQLELIKRLKALSEIGLVYAENGYDKERYEEIRKISFALLEEVTGKPLELLQNFFLPEKDYPTAKVDVRAFTLNENDEILLVRENFDGKWTIPGGWADIGHTPKEAVIKEVAEETGFDAEIVRPLAIYDKRCHAHPPQPFYVYKLVFFCRILGGEPRPGFDIRDVGFFPLEGLPELSKDRILKSQLEHLFGLAKDEKAKVYFDG